MKEVTVVRYQTYDGVNFDSAQECAEQELGTSIRRLFSELWYSGISSSELAEEVVRNADNFRAVLSGDFSCVMTDEEKAGDKTNLLQKAKEGKSK
jgi:hypothetical protein